MAKDLLYRPNLEYNKNYYTEGQKDKNDFNFSDGNNNNNDISKEDIIDNLKNEIDKKIPMIPNDIINSYIPPYYVMDDEYKNLVDNKNNNDKEDNEDKDKNKDNDNNKNEQDKDKNDKDDNEEDDKDKDAYPSDPFNKGEDVYVDFKDPLADYSKIIDERYYINFLDIYQDYLNKLSETLDKYIYGVLDTMVKNPLKDNPHIYNTKHIKNSNVWHLTDFLTKSNIYVQQKLRLHKKFFDIDESIIHIRGIKVAKEQSLRYYKINPVEEKDDLDVSSNLLLQESRYVSEKKYKDNLLNLYKYLNSSVILLDESLNLSLKQAKSIATINRYEKRDKK